MAELFDLNINEISSEVDLLEVELQSLLIRHWRVFFNDLIFITKEFQLIGDVRQVNKNGRIDILAFNMVTNRFVIIELKKEFDVNVRSQAFDYMDFFVDNKHELYLRASEIISLPPYCKIDSDNVEIILFAKRFKDTDVKLAKSDQFPFLTLISYSYFSNNKLLLSVIKREQKNNIKNNDIATYTANDIDNFWLIFNSLIKLNHIRNEEHFKLIKFADKFTLCFNLSAIYEKYVLLSKEHNIGYLRISDLRKMLSNLDYYKGLICSTRIGDKNSSAYSFDMTVLKEKIKI